MKKNILLVDDDPLVLKSLSTLLEKEGYAVSAAGDGRSAIQKAKEGAFDLVISDIRMPGMDGLQTIEEIQGYQKKQGNPPSHFMVITGFAEDEAPQRAVDLQITEFLIKPFDASRFLQAVREQFQARETAQLDLASVPSLEKRSPVPLAIPNLKDGAFWFEKVILLKDTNLMGNVYFANFALWQGELRELILLSHPHFKEEMAKMPDLKMITHSMYHRFLHEVTFGDTLTIRVNSREIKKTSLILVFRYFLKQNNKISVGEGWQRIAFADLKTGNPCYIPGFIRELAEAMEEKVSTTVTPLKWH